MDRIISSIRVAAAAVVGWFLTIVAQYLGVGIDEATEASLVAAVQLILTVAYYVAVRATEIWLPKAAEYLSGGRLKERMVRRWITAFLFIPRLPIQIDPDDEVVATQALRQHHLRK